MIKFKRHRKKPGTQWTWCLRDLDAVILENKDNPVDCANCINKQIKSKNFDKRFMSKG